MKILYVRNTAGVFSPLAKWLNNNGHEARILVRKRQDGFNQTQSSGCAVMAERPRDVYWKMLKLLWSFRPDVIHISSDIQMLVIIRLLRPFTAIVFTYHGGDVRGRSERHPEMQLADMVSVTTPDLRAYGVWIERPIDPMFYYRGGRVPRTALFQYAAFWLRDTRPLADQWCRERGVTLTVLNRSSPDFVPIDFPRMPEFLSRFEYYLDFKGHGAEAFALSKTALEAMACGCKVIHDRDLNHVVTTTDEDVMIGGVYAYVVLYRNLGKAPLRKALRRLPYNLYTVVGALRVMFGRKKP